MFDCFRERMRSRSINIHIYIYIHISLNDSRFFCPSPMCVKNNGVRSGQTLNPISPLKIFSRINNVKLIVINEMYNLSESQISDPVASFRIVFFLFYFFNSSFIDGLIIKYV